MRFFFILSFLALNNAFGASLDSLKQADSYYSLGKYTEALELYQNLYEKGYYSPASLLKMAFIEEGSDNYHKSLYYLEKYKKLNKDRNANFQIKKIANQYSLEGYNESNFEIISFWIKQNDFPIKAGLLLFILLFVFLIYKSKQKMVLVSIQVLLLGALFFVLFNNTAKYGILSENNVALRKNPSAAADIAEKITNKGHKVKILKSNFPWVKILWRNQTYFVRHNFLDKL